MTKHDMPERLASWADALPDSVTSRLLREAADEIVSLRLTDEERVAIQWVIGEALSVDGVSIHATLRRLLERLSPLGT